jgi:hypothetical protein
MPCSTATTKKVSVEGICLLREIALAFIPISGFRPDNRGVKYMSTHADAIEVWLVPLPSTGLFLIAFPYRRLSGLVRSRCFRSKGALTRRDARLVSVTHQTRLCQRRLRDSSGMSAIGTKRTFTRSPREVWFRPKADTTKVVAQ